MARPPLPAPPHRGGCACGAVRFRLTAQPRAVNACHCLDCKRLSGSDAAVFLHQPTETFAIDSGTFATFRRTADSGRVIDVVRCATCGTRLWHKPLAVPELTLVVGGTLDESGWVIPTSHIWMKDATGQMAVASDALTFAVSVPNRQMIWDRFSELYGL